MEIRKASKQQTKIKIIIAGISSSGKTYSSLRLAKGLTGSYEKVCVIEASERNGSDLYSDIGNFSVLELQNNSPEEYIKAIELVEKNGFDCVIIDSMSHVWNYITDSVDETKGYSAWKVPKLRLKHLIDKILSTKIHLIATLRMKADVVLEQNEKGKMAPRKVGMKIEFQKDFDYEPDIMFEIERESHFGIAVKDRTGLFLDQKPKMLDETDGEKIVNWCQNGIMPTNKPEVKPKSQTESKEVIDYKVITSDWKITTGEEVSMSQFLWAIQYPDVFKGITGKWFTEKKEGKRTWVRFDSKEADKNIYGVDKAGKPYIVKKQS